MRAAEDGAVEKPGGAAAVEEVAILTPEQVQEAVGSIEALAKAKDAAGLEKRLRFVMGQPGARRAMAWVCNQLIVAADKEATADNWPAALAIYQAIPANAEILRIQDAELEPARKEVAALKEKAKAAGAANPPAELVKAEEVLKRMEASREAIAAVRDLDAQLLMRRGRSLYYLERDKEALPLFEEIRVKYPDAVDAEKAAYAEVVILNAAKDWAEVAARAKSYVEKYPKAAHVEAVASLMGEARIGQDKWDEVREHFKGMAVKYPASKDIDSYVFYQAIATFQLGEFAEAAEMMKKFVEGYPKSSRRESALYHVAMGYFLSNKSAEAQEAIERHLKEFPGNNSPDMVYRMAVMAAKEKVPGWQKEVIAMTSEQLKKTPDDPVAGGLLVLRGDTWLAMEPSEPNDAVKTAAEVKVRQGKALEDYKKVVDTKAPEESVIYAVEEAIKIMRELGDEKGIEELRERVR